MNKLKAIGMFICIALTAAVVCAAAAFATGCDKEPERPKYRLPKNCDVILEAEGGWEAPCEEAPCEEAPCENFIIVCDTYEELQEELLRHGIKMLEVNAKKVREYADEHKDKSYVVCYCVFNEYLGTYRIKEVEVDNGRLTMYIRYPGSPDTIIAAPEVLCSELFIAGVDKSFVANVTEGEYVFVW